MRYILAVAASLTCFVGVITAGGGSMPPNWWENTLGTPITSNSMYKELIAGKLDENEVRQPGTIANKHIFIDFYMQHCYWCYDFQADWN